MEFPEICEICSKRNMDLQRYRFPTLIDDRTYVRCVEEEVCVLEECEEHSKFMMVSLISV